MKDSGDKEQLRRVSVDYTLTAANACALSVRPDGDSKFRFVYTSGMGTERDQDRGLWLADDFRKLRVFLPLFH